MAESITDAEASARLLRLTALCVASETAAAESEAEHSKRTGYPDRYTAMLTVEQVRAVLDGGYDADHLTFEQAEEQVKIAELALIEAQKQRTTVWTRDGYDK